jgi:hypothetical protein
MYSVFDFGPSSRYEWRGTRESDNRIVDCEGVLILIGRCGLFVLRLD